jgi:U3 small nucleolar RNA-associated protein 3
MTVRSIVAGVQREEAKRSLQQSTPTGTASCSNTMEPRDRVSCFLRAGWEMTLGLGRREKRGIAVTRGVESTSSFPNAARRTRSSRIADPVPLRPGMDELSSDDEIYGLNLPSQPSDDDGGAQEEEDDEDFPDEDEDDDEGATTKPLPADEPRGRFAKPANPSQDILSDASSVASDAEEAVNSSDEEETWAAGSYHASRRAPGEADSSDDEALDLEADEARRLQKKAKAVMGGEDFGFGTGEDEEGVEQMRMQARGKGRLEDVDAEEGEGAKEGENKKEWSEEEAIAHLLKKSPETLALLDDFTATAERIKGVEKSLETVRKGDEDGKEHPALAIMELEHR